MNITLIAVENQNKISFETANELIRIDRNTGEMFWKKRDRKWFNSDRIWKSWNTSWAGSPAFTAEIGENGSRYKVGYILGIKFRAARVAFLLYHKRWPSGLVDHINGNSKDDSIDNIREVSASENNKNQKLNSRNRSGIVGVSWYEPYKKWRVRILRKTLGYFDSFEKAVLVRKEAEIKFGFHPNHGRKKVIAK